MIAAIAVATFAALVLPLAGTASAVTAVTSLDVTPLNATNVVGVPHDITVTALDAVNVGVPNILIAADVSGANATATITSCTTDVNGVCTVSYTGTQPGTDTITVCVDIATTNGTCDAGELSVTATKTYVLAPAQCSQPGAITGTNGPDTLLGTSGDDIICGFGGNDTIHGFGGNDTIYGGGGADTIYGGRGGDSIRGGGGADTIYGGSGGDTIYGGAGNDTLRGGRGADTIKGGRGRDRVLGGRNNDVLFGGPGNDILDGGPGFDICSGGPGVDVKHHCEG